MAKKYKMRKARRRAGLRRHLRSKARPNPRKHRRSAAQRRAAIRNLRAARRAIRSKKNPSRRRRRSLKRNPGEMVVYQRTPENKREWKKLKARLRAAHRRAKAKSKAGRPKKRGGSNKRHAATKARKHGRARPSGGQKMARKKSRKGGKKHRTRKQLAAARRNLKKARAALRRKGRTGRKHRRGGKSRRHGRYTYRSMRVVRSRRGKGSPSRRRGLSTLRRARRMLKGRRRVGPLARRYAKRFRMSTNPGGIVRTLVRLAKPAAFALGGLATVAYLPNLLGMIPVVGTFLGPNVGWAGVLASTVSAGVLIWFLNSRFAPRMLKGANATPIMIGAGLGVLQQIIGNVAPGILTPKADGMAGTWTEGTAPLADYVADGVDLGGYVPELGGLGLNVEQALAGYVTEGPISQAVAGLGSPALTAMARARGDAWTASGPIPARPIAHLGASYGGIFNKGIFGQ